MTTEHEATRPFTLDEVSLIEAAKYAPPEQDATALANGPSARMGFSAGFLRGYRMREEVRPGEITLTRDQATELVALLKIARKITTDEFCLDDNECKLTPTIKMLEAELLSEGKESKL
jgi:hypothetical protein